MISKLTTISSLKFEKMLLEYWELTRITDFHTPRLYRQFTEVWKWFYHKQRINKNQFNELFLRLMRDTKHLVRLHGAPTGSYNERTWLQIPDNREFYHFYARGCYGLWSLETANSRLDDWCGKQDV